MSYGLVQDCNWHYGDSKLLCAEQPQDQSVEKKAALHLAERGWLPEQPNQLRIRTVTDRQWRRQTLCSGIALLFIEPLKEG